MAYNERCKHCGFKEGAHDIANDIRFSPPAACVYLRGDISREEALRTQFKGDDVPCENFESKVEHLPDCPIWLDIGARELYCQELAGGCEQLIRIQNEDEDPP